MTYSVQEVANQLGLTSYTIRYYDDHGLIPGISRDANNNRVFGDEALQWTQLVSCLRKTGMPLSDIKHYVDLALDGDDTIPERYKIMVTQQQRTMDQLNDLQDQLTIVNQKVDHYAQALINHHPDNFVKGPRDRESVNA
ncbi:MerR family transcriptional regulator [Levilactobacillus bambusae]|uniref:MerR family transcriptional regulator n=1 Tax=Levilactobacillus bambusae TaxID=2024736 RepID=A0A2V1N3I8_9LACO|nr:MerR family transcriptional regulator [Levilactobacillus bambusae]PWG00550.1 MerR family transcriptional regulator [Levilactobacillus bambusae]